MVTISTMAAVAIDGLAFGVFLALLGVGITLVFGLGEVLNLSIGVFSVIAVLIASWAVNSGQGVIVAAVIGVLVAAGIGLLVDRTLLSLVYRSTGEERILLGIFVTLGLTVFLDGFFINGLSLTSGIAIPSFPGSYGLPVDLPTVTIGAAVVRSSSLVVIGVGAVALAILFSFLRLTYLGKATRTVFQDEQGAQLVGVNPRRIRTLIFVLSVTVAGIAGVVWAVGQTVSVADGFQYTTFALIVSIVGGVRSLGGAIVAGVLLGFVNQFANFFVGSYVATVILFGAAIVFLLAKPEAIA
ncbi:branched-chain amino acid ABC transporter permease (plasmid) [Halobaculum sp. CBA1158]|uniref:branched-chain amino acid ABC transporter permease n=1 Tax=Halobaculum sp. CBA1158 TaxID=2904243 RepID=UPI001F2B30F0|nr:branched-chain amino acid ABC transporter permease [Halobaculum sp. CBA1158]UIP01503.1 branched-chain amino acid ABC transporter permease [Halobaculum sp. CBA1158]